MSSPPSLIHFSLIFLASLSRRRLLASYIAIISLSKFHFRVADITMKRKVVASAYDGRPRFSPKRHQFPTPLHGLFGHLVNLRSAASRYRRRHADRQTLFNISLSELKRHLFSSRKMPRLINTLLTARHGHDDTTRLNTGEAAEERVTISPPRPQAHIPHAERAAYR